MSTDSPQCEATIGAVRCQLPERHNSPHEHGDADGKTTWEPSYVGDLRYELKHGPHMWRALLSDVIDDIGPSLHSEAIGEARDALASEPT